MQYFTNRKNIDTGRIRTFISWLGQKKLGFLKVSGAILFFIKSHKMHLDFLLHYKS